MTKSKQKEDRQDEGEFFIDLKEVEEVFQKVSDLSCCQDDRAAHCTKCGADDMIETEKYGAESFGIGWWTDE